MRPRTLSAPLVAGIVLALALTTPPAWGAATDDVTIAEAGTIQATDVPETFTETSPMEGQVGVPADDSDGSMLRLARRIPQCRGFVDAFGGKPEGVTASANGATLDGDTSQASSSVLVFETTADAESLYLPLSKPSLATCLNRLFEKSAEESVTGGGSRGVTLDKLTAKVTPHPVPPVGDATDDYQIKVSMKASQKVSGKTRRVTLTMYADMQFVRTGRALAFYSFFALGSPDDAMQQPAVVAASTRLAQALGG